jgi:hypothetical protein
MFKGDGERYKDMHTSMIKREDCQITHNRAKQGTSEQLNHPAIVIMRDTTFALSDLT